MTRSRSKDDDPRPRYWAFQANPNIYNIEAAVRHIDVDTWPIKGRDVRIGDKVIIWKALGGSHRRGVVALGEVISDPELSPAAKNDFLVNSSSDQSSEPRVRIRYVCPPLLPLWLGDAMEPVVERLSVSRARGTVFRVTKEQWEEVVEAAGGWPGEAD